VEARRAEQAHLQTPTRSRRRLSASHVSGRLQAGSPSAQHPLASGGTDVIEQVNRRGGEGSKASITSLNDRGGGRVEGLAASRPWKATSGSGLVPRITPWSGERPRRRWGRHSSWGTRACARPSSISSNPLDLVRCGSRRRKCEGTEPGAGGGAGCGGGGRGEVARSCTEPEQSRAHTLPRVGHHIAWSPKSEGLAAKAL